jgi:hypothetical protein
MSLFGWCIDGLHESCPRDAQGQAVPLVCDCDCHGSED